MIRENLLRVLSEIESVRRSDQKVTLVAVTKNHGVEQMREAIDGGVSNIGENRVQEALEKFKTLDRNVVRHLIGHLQTNKVKPAVEHFDLIHSVDSQRLANALNRAANSIGKVQDVLIQVNLAREETKSGVEPEALEELISTVEGSDHLKYRGLMMIAPNFDDVEQCRPLFREMYRLFLRQREIHPTVEYLSMGMTHDYKIAVEEGANLIRIGTAIFGERDYR